MSVLRSDIMRQALPVHHGHAAPATARNRKILAVVDGSARTADVLEFLIAQSGGGPPQEVVLLNVQPLPEDWRLRGYGSFKQEEIRAASSMIAPGRSS